MKVVATIPVALGSDDTSALALVDLAGKPLIGHVLDRLAQVDKLGGIIVATTTNAADDPIEAYCRARNTPCFRGDAEDLLGRILAALKFMDAKGGAVVYTDCPLVDPAIIDHVVNLIQMTDGMLDWVGTNLSQTYPIGMEVEGFTVAALDESDRRCADAEIRRQGTLYIRQNSRYYRLLSVAAPAEHHWPELALNVASQADVAAISKIVRYFNGRTDFTLTEILQFLGDNPDLRGTKNASVI
jgi:spore coat polysaccharide biosynthesis protein SpsF